MGIQTGISKEILAHLLDSLQPLLAGSVEGEGEGLLPPLPKRGLEKLLPHVFSVFSSPTAPPKPFSHTAAKLLPSLPPATQPEGAEGPKEGQKGRGVGPKALFPEAEANPTPQPLKAAPAPSRGAAVEKRGGEPAPQKKIGPSPLQQQAETLVVEVKQAIRMLAPLIAAAKPPELQKALGRLKPLLDGLIEAVGRGETPTSSEKERRRLHPTPFNTSKEAPLKEIDFPFQEEQALEKGDPKEKIAVRQEKGESPPPPQKTEQVRAQLLNLVASGTNKDILLPTDRTMLTAAPFLPQSLLQRKGKEKKKRKTFWFREEEKEEPPFP